MIMKLFKFIFEKLICKLDDKQKEKARKLFLDLVKVIVAGAVEGAKK